MKFNRLVLMLGAALAAPLVPAPLAAEPAARSLTLSQAEDLAIRNHPRITQAELSAMVAREQIVQQRSAFFPSIFGHATAVGAADPNNTRVAAGFLNNPSIYDRNAEGAEVRQLITDFGRTRNLLESSKLRSRAEEKGALATEAQVLMQLDASYFGVLQALAVEKVAVQTIATRQTLFEQVAVLATNKLRSEMDLSFARVGLEDAKLLQSRAENDLAAARATLTLMLGERDETNYALAELPLPADLREEASALVQEALQKRPETAQARFEAEAARRFARAEHELSYPVIMAYGAGGVIPVHGSQFQDNYGAAGVDLSLPIFTGGLYTSRARAADFQTSRAEENVRDIENVIIRDVRVSYQNARYAKQKLDETAQLLISTGQALDLATARYKVGSSSIIEVSQAQLNQTAAQIEQATATYGYLTQRSILNLQAGRLPPGVSFAPGGRR
jgi:outer membrane protein